MLTKLEVRTMQGGLLTLPLQDTSAGYVVKDIEGLDPVKATIVFSSYAQQDGTQFQSAFRENRNIVLKIDHEANYATISNRDLRSNLYKYLMTKSMVKLRFYEDDDLVVEIVGRVEDHTSPRFTKAPDAIISIVCNDPDFYVLDTTTFGGNTTAGTTETNHTYPGTVETGFIFTLNVDRTISGFTLYNTPEDNALRSLLFAAPMIAGDVLKISTVSGSKYARLTRSGVESSVLFGVSPISNWLELFPGVNKLRAQVSGAAIPWTIDYVTKYGAL